MNRGVIMKITAYTTYILVSSMLPFVKAGGVTRNGVTGSTTTCKLPPQPDS